MSRSDPDRASGARLAVTFLRIGAMNEMQYRVNFFIQLIQSLLNIGVGLIALGLVFGRTRSLGGWSRPELLAVMGVFTLAGGAIRSVIQPNMQRVVDDVREGRLDFALTKPADAQVLVSVRDVQFWQLTDVLVGAVVMTVALVQLRDRLPVGHLVAFVGMLLLGLVTIYCFWLLLASASFWLVRMNEVQELFQGVYRAGAYPVGIYPAWLKYGLTVVVPLAFAVTVPAEAVTGRLSGRTVLVTLAAVVVLVAFSRWAWRRGLRRYSGASA